MKRRPLIVATGLLAACAGEPGSNQPATPSVAASASAETPPPGTVVDSAFPIAEHLRRFRIGVDSLDRFYGGSPTPERLAVRLLDAVTRRDTVDLARMALSRPEFAWLYYPSHLYRDPPYELDPTTFWMMIQGNSEKGLIRLLRRYGGTKLRYRALRCARSTNVSPPLREAGRCTVEFTAAGDPQSRRMFGSIVGDGHSYKFVSYANEF